MNKTIERVRKLTPVICRQKAVAYAKLANKTSNDKARKKLMNLSSWYASKARHLTNVKREIVVKGKVTHTKKSATLKPDIIEQLVQMSIADLKNLLNKALEKRISFDLKERESCLNAAIKAQEIANAAVKTSQELFKETQILARKSVGTKQLTKQKR